MLSRALRAAAVPATGRRAAVRALHGSAALATRHRPAGVPSNDDFGHAASCRPRQPATAAPTAAVSEAEFPCLDKIDAKTTRLAQALQQQSASADATSAADADQGPEPSYATTKLRGYKTWRHTGRPFHLDLGGVLPEFTLAYETWGELNADASNAILLHTGLSASSHARSHPDNTDRGWWEDFIGPNAPLDTSKYFVICTNSLGGCFGSTGPSSVDPARSGDERYAARFPYVTVWDMVRAQRALLQALGIGKLHACVGASMGGMQSQAYAALYPAEVGRLVSISSCARAHPYSIALRFVQRQILMNDPAYAATRGNYYGGMPPHVGMKLAREVATITYRSGPEWERRFGRKRVDGEPSLCPDYLIETYLDHQGEKFSLGYDANSLLYLSKAMDMYDMSAPSLAHVAARKRSPWEPAPPLPPLPPASETLSAEDQLALGMSELQMPTLVLGVTSDILFPLPQQAEIATTLRKAGNDRVTYYVLDAEYGHDTFLIDRISVGAAVAGHLV
ncbi:Serine O-succinyltransferase [Blastocladiella emersonii ATCC 22665]|nr:Serine O-succinyltransferase [Blastocladiella emersonii ATCC 22665]